MSYADDLTEAELTALENRIREEYKTSYYALRAKADRYFAEYEERWQEQYDAYMRGVYTEAEFHAWEETQLARGARWEALASEMAQGMTDADIVASAYINDATPSIYSLHANYTAYEIGGGVQGVSFTMYDEQTVKLLMMGENFSEFRTVKIDPVRDYEWNRSQIQKALTASILQGNDIKQMTNAFLGVMQRDENSARRNARTAFTSAQNGGRLEGMRQAVKQGIKVRKRWLSAHDGRVRDSHAMLDGQIRDIEKVFDNGCMFPSDPAGRPEEVYNCRCTLTYIYPEFDDKKSAEIYRDQALEGETYQQFVNRMRNEAKMRKAKDEELIFNTLNNTKGDTIKPKSLINGMRKSELGSSLLEELMRDGVAVNILYGIDNPDGILGCYYPYEDVIDIFGDACRTKKRATSTLVHEAMHRRLRGENLTIIEEEVKCFEAEYIHEHGKLTTKAKGDILKMVTELYG